VPRARATQEQRHARARLPGLKNHAAGVSEAALLQSTQALKLRLNGYTYRAIGRVLGIDAKTAWRQIEHALADALDERDEAAERAKPNGHPENGERRRVYDA